MKSSGKPERTTPMDKPEKDIVGLSGFQALSEVRKIVPGLRWCRGKLQQRVDVMVTKDGVVVDGYASWEDVPTEDE